MAYKPIESYGVIGDLHTVALVGMDGSIDWCCLPQFDSPSIFAAILDEHKGGFFKIASLYEAQHKQMYLPDSNVLVTRFLSPEGVGEVVDFMPVQDPSHGKKTHRIVRVVRAVRGAGELYRARPRDRRWPDELRHLAKSVFQIHGVDGAGNVIVRRQLKRRYVLSFFQKLPPCLVGIEACVSSHRWSREYRSRLVRSS